jgi:uroporphyrinogen decarboxylase
MLAATVADVESTSASIDLSAGFGGLRVVALESRLAVETARLIEKAGGVAISAPSMREVPIGENPEALAFAERLLAGKYDIVILLTGVGTRHLFAAMETHYDRASLVAALSKTTVVARGPKPVAALRELGVAIAIAVPEPNTWRELLDAIVESNRAVDLGGARIAIQEYGESNPRLIEGLRARGADVDAVPVYRWALPENRQPLADAVRQLRARTVDVVLFTSATQVRHLFQQASEMGWENDLHGALEEVVVASVGPVCSETLAELAVGVDLEPEHPKLGHLVREAAGRASAILAAKRAAHRPARAPAMVKHAAAPPRKRLGRLEESVFLQACRGEPVAYTPVWLMRQAGRYMQEYREVRARVPFIELCKKPDLAAEVAITAQQRIGTDAAILFSDILLLVEPMGLGLEYAPSEGPAISRVVRCAADVDRLQRVVVSESLAYVFEAVRKTRTGLPADIPLIGFSGAPFTLASYIIEGGSSRNYTATKTFMYTDEGAWNAMMSLVSDAIADYLAGQIEAGCQALQLFDSWVGCLSPADYARYVLPHTRRIIESLPRKIPLILFGTDTATLLDHQATAGARVLGVDHRVAIGQVFDRYPGIAVQGNLDPVVLFAEPAFIRAAARSILDEVARRPGHIFNLGHGVLPATPVDHVIALVDAVHELSARR